MPSRPARALAAVLVPVLAPALGACGGSGDVVPVPADPAPVRALPAYDPDADRPAAAAALGLVPAAADLVAVTDFDASRADLGLPDLTSVAGPTERSEYWSRARQETVLLAESRLRPEDSRLLLDYGLTSDDVDWEAGWTTPDGAGWALGLRPDLDLAGLRRAVTDGVPGLEGARVDADLHVLHRGAVTDGSPTWADRDGVRELVPGEDATAALYRADCVPLREAMGPDAGAEVQERVVRVVDPRDLDPLGDWSVSFDGGLATVRLGRDRADLAERSALSAGWPLDRFGAVFGPPVEDPGTGRIGLPVRRPVEAAGLALGGVSPYAVCDDVAPVEEPSGL